MVFEVESIPPIFLDNESLHGFENVSQFTECPFGGLLGKGTQGAMINIDATHESASFHEEV